MPLTVFQERIAHLLAGNRDAGSYLAGGAALHLDANSLRFSDDLDFFHDSVERVAVAFELDRQLLEAEGMTVDREMAQPGYIWAVVGAGTQQTKVEWAHDSAWRFLPVVADTRVGFRLHPVDLAINKLLALVGRDEARDFLDVLEIDRRVLSLGALCWAAAGKDPGFTPLSLLDLLRRRGKYHPEDFFRLHLARTVDVQEIKGRWLGMLDEAERFIRSRPSDEIGCLYYSPSRNVFVAPLDGQDPDAVPHFGRPGGILPRVLEDS
ncbi:MAG: hypothetical protein K8R59_00045 [Thermoanaerobaculales bacterium]|nr:hypothetical protein [Thermoanaerobaculales bacterium]